MNAKKAFNSIHGSIKPLFASIVVPALVGVALVLTPARAHADELFDNATVTGEEIVSNVTAEHGEGTLAAAVVDDGETGDVMPYAAPRAATVSGLVPLPVGVELHQSDAFRLLSMVNNLRSRKGMASLVWDSDLEQAAIQRAAEASIFCAHTRPDGSSYVTAFSQASKPVGEAIDYGYKSADSAFDGFSQLQDNQALMVNGRATRFAAAGVYNSQAKNWYWVLLFAEGGSGSQASQQKDGAATIGVPLPESFIQSVRAGRDALYLGVASSQELPSLQVELYGTIQDTEGGAGSTSVTATVTYSSGSFAWSSANASSVRIATSGSKAMATGVVPGTSDCAATLPASVLQHVSGTVSDELAFTVPVAVADLTRLAGAGRYQTMQAVVQEAFPKGSDVAVLASGENFPDALSASGLSGAFHAPVVLTSNGGRLTDAARQTLTALSPSTVYVLGSASAISDGAMQEVKSIRGVSKVERLAGAGRYDTSLSVARKTQATSGARTVFIATGEGFADALSASPWAYTLGAPVLLTPKTGLTSQMVSWIKSSGFKRAIVLGSAASVPDSVVSALKGAGVSQVNRLAGPGRYETSLKIAKAAVSEGTLTMNGAVWATGEKFADALSGSSLAGSKGAALVLTQATGPKEETLALALKAPKGYVLGSTDTLPENVVYSLAQAMMK